MPRTAAEFIKEIQESEDHIKRRWLIFFSSVAMFAVVFLWVGYFNGLVMPANSNSAGTANDQKESGQNLTFWGTFRSGLGTVAETVGKGINRMTGILMKPKTYTITPQQ